MNRLHVLVVKITARQYFDEICNDKSLDDLFNQLSASESEKSEAINYFKKSFDSKNNNEKENEDVIEPDVSSIPENVKQDDPSIDIPVLDSDNQVLTNNADEQQIDVNRKQRVVDKYKRKLHKIEESMPSLRTGLVDNDSNVSHKVFLRSLNEAWTAWEKNNQEVKKSVSNTDFQYKKIIANYIIHDLFAMCVEHIDEQGQETPHELLEEFCKDEAISSRFQQLEATDAEKTEILTYLEKEFSKDRNTPSHGDE